jgi:hypothetical protein
MDLDKKIKKKFRLFEGIRSEDEDKKIYDKIYELCFDEMVLFLTENLESDELKKFEKELKHLRGGRTDSSDGGQENEVIALLLNNLRKIDNYRFRLDKRLDYFLNNLLISSLKKVSNQEGSTLKVKDLKKVEP